MEKLPGKRLDWNGANAQQRVRVMEQLADVYLELEKHPISMTGSLVPVPAAVAGKSGAIPGDNEGARDGPFAQLPCFETPDKALGPFRTLEAAYTAIVRQQMRSLADREISSLPVDNYLVFSWRLTALSTLIAGSVSPKGPFYLRHYDDKGDHILVDDQFNITGLIDWDFASAEAKELAFSSPCMMWPVGQFYDGSNALAEDERRFAAIFEKRGRSDMGQPVRRGRRWQRYLFFLGGGIPSEIAELKSLFAGLRKSFASEDADSEDGVSIVLFETWKQAALAGFSKEDAQLQALLRNKRATGRTACGE